MFTVRWHGIRLSALRSTTYDFLPGAGVLVPSIRAPIFRMQLKNKNKLILIVLRLGYVMLKVGFGHCEYLYKLVGWF